MLALLQPDIQGQILEDPNPSYTWACSALTLQTKKEGFFKDYAEQVEQSLSASSWTVFGRLTDNESRIRFCMGLTATQCLQAKPFYRAKCAADAAGLRDQAELFLQVGNAKAALQLLSRSIMRAPAPGTPEDNGQKLLAHSFVARARALLSLGLFELALRDTQCALSTGLPQGTQRSRLLDTQGQCYEATGQMLRAKLAFASAAQLLEAGEENDTWRNELLTASRRCEDQISTAPTASTTKPAELPKVTAGESLELPSASRLLTVAHAPDVGRYVHALEAVHTGDTLVVEPAYVACLLTEKSGTHCHHCFARVEAPVSCPVCSGVAFCGPNCQAEACETYHKVECRFNNLFIGSGMSILCYLALRMVTRAGTADKFAALWKAANQSMKEKSSKKVTARSTTEDPEVEKYRRVLELVSHDKQRTTKDFLHRTLMAIFLLKCLREANFFSKVSTKNTSLNETECIVAQALLKHLQILQFNAHEVVETLAKAKARIKGSRTQYIGVALYCSVALFNHDCYPGVARSFQGTNLIIHALRPLKPGQVVAENYGPIFTKRNIEERQKALRSRYWFICQCRACKENWPDYDGGMALQVKSTAAQSFNELAFVAMESGNLDQAILLFCALIDSVHDVITLPDREVCLAMDALRLCLAARWGTVVIPEVRERPVQDSQEDRVQIAELVE